jgi:dihydrodipicolinate reductase
MKSTSIKEVTVILIIAFFAGIVSVEAQQASDEVNLTVRLAQMQNIEVKTGQENVLIEFTTPDHFQNGVSTSKSEHLAVSSTTGFQ